MTNKILEERIAKLEDRARGYDKSNSYGSETMETASEALEIINGLQMRLRVAENAAKRRTNMLQSKPCEYIHQGKDGTSYCKLAASHGKELEEARRVIEELRGQLELKKEIISNLINGE